MTLFRLAVAVTLLHSSLFAASVKSWDINDYASFLGGTLQDVSLTHEGQLRIAAGVQVAHDSEDAVTWTSAAATDGTVYLGTGHSGRLYRVNPNGESELLWSAPEIEIFAVAVAPNGDVYVGTSPSGKVYRVASDGTADEFFDPGQQYIWQLQFGPTVSDGAFGGSEALFVGTGPEGKVYRVEADGTGEVWFDTQQRHVTALELGPDGSLLAAADPSGILFRIDGKGQAFALYDSSLPEIRNLHVTADGSIYLAAMGGAISLSDNMMQSVATAAAITTISVTATAGGTGTTAPITAPQPVTIQPAPPSPVVNYGVETSTLILLRPGERAETLWTSTQENILAMTVPDDDSDSVLLATDQSGRLYRVDRQGHVELLSQTDEQQITSLTPSSRGLVMTAAHGSPTTLMTDAPASTGRYETAPLDALGISSWGQLAWRGTGEVKLTTRSGNTERPDNTWSDWSAPIEGAGGGLIHSPAARYLQWSAELNAPDQSLDSVRVSYLPGNARPSISAVTVTPEAGADGQSQGSSAVSNPYTITVSADAGTTAVASDSVAVPSVGNGRLRISWAAVDLDGDSLLAHIEFRGEGESRWKTLRRDVSESFIVVDADVLANGRYRFRVSVSDTPDNPGNAARTADRISSEVLIDHTPPQIEVISQDDAAVYFRAIDLASPITDAHYSVDGGRWQALLSDDGITDSPSESFSVPLDSLEGERLITIRVRDQASNAGLAKALVGNE